MILIQTITQTTDCRLTAAVDTRVKPSLGKASGHSDRLICEKSGAKPVHLSTKLWWSYATEVTLANRLNFAQVFFHYDLIDYRSIQFFFYLTDVDLSSGPHVCVLGSHQNKKLTHQLSFFTGRSDQDIINYYGTDNLKFVCGKAGLGFVEDPYCFHKGIPPSQKNRLMLKIVFGVNTYQNYISYQN